MTSPSWRQWAVLALAGALLAGVADAEADPPQEPRLVLAIVIDQARHEYLNRFAQDFQGGIARLLEHGAVFTDAQLHHYPTVTAVGHATLLSGALPSTSGIIGNDWYDRDLKRNVTSVWDPEVSRLGAPGPGSSPHRLLVSTVGDELKTAESGPKVIGISRKDRAAILSVGRSADAAYWVDDDTGDFVSSSWYFDRLPAWVDAFNARDVVGSYAGQLWLPLVGGGRGFGMLPSEPRQRLVGAVASTPFSNEMLVAFAEAAIAGEKLGQRGVTDLLVVSFSANDNVGHGYGPESPQMRDITLRTDREMGRLFDVVDRDVGLAHTLVVFTSDHGVAPVPEEQAARHGPGGRLTRSELFDQIEAGLDARFGRGDWIAGTAGSSPYLNHELIRKKRLDPAEVRQATAEIAEQLPHVARVFTREQLLSGQVPDEAACQRVGRSYNPARSGDLEILLEPFWIAREKGTTHGTPYVYDTHVPLIFMGPGIAAGRYHRPVTLNDVATTLATMLSVEIPSNAAGRTLDEMLAPPGP